MSRYTLSILDHEESTVAAVKFEQAMARLEAIVGQLENGDLSLDESLKIFEEGIRLSKNCLKVLEEAERKVEVLVQDTNGKKQLRAFSLEDNADEASLES